MLDGSEAHQMQSLELIQTIVKHLFKIFKIKITQEEKYLFLRFVSINFN